MRDWLTRLRAALSLRTLALLAAAILLLPLLIPGTDAIWLAVVVAELLGLTVTTGFLIRMRKTYHYA